MKIFLLSLLLVATNAFADCEDHVIGGLPSTSEPTSLLCRIGYTVAHLDRCKAPMITMQRLLPENLGGTEPRQTFKADPQLDARFRAVPKDYVKSGFDKGHLAPAADFKSDSVTMLQSFYLSNAVPQVPTLNRGTWRSLEMWVRALTMRHKEMFVYTGAIFADDAKIGSGVCVPTHLYKVIISPRLNQSVGFLIPNTKESGRTNFKNFAVEVIQIEHAAGVNFTPDSTKFNKEKIAQEFLK